MKALKYTHYPINTFKIFQFLPLHYTRRGVYITMKNQFEYYFFNNNNKIKKINNIIMYRRPPIIIFELFTRFNKRQTISFN